MASFHYPLTGTGWVTAGHQIYLWVRKSEFDRGLDRVLFKAVKEWVRKSWPFGNPAYPGREISWETWEATPEQ